MASSSEISLPQPSMGPATFQNWQVAQAQLDRALDTFLDVCSALYLARHSAESELHSFAHDRLDLVTAMEYKMAKSAALLRQVRNASPTNTPTNRLPPEILTRVFTLCLPPFPYRSAEANPHPLFMITQVCAQWRRVATTTPSLWSQIMIDDEEDDDDPPKYTSPLKQARIWLDRANGVPLSVHIQMQTYEEEEEELVNILLPHLPRIIRLRLRGVTTSLFRTLLCLLWVETRFDALSAFDVERLSWERSLELSNTKWTRIHNLRELKLSELYLHESNSLPAQDLATILANSPNLQILRLHNIAVQPADLSGYPDISLPALKRLEIGIRIKNDGLQALLSIIRPCQIELDVVLAVPGGHGDTTISSLRGLLRGSNAVTLDMKVFEDYAHELLADYLDCVPNIRTLTLERVTLDSFFTSTQLPRRLSKIVLRHPRHHVTEYKHVVACLAEQGIEIVYGS